MGADAPLDFRKLFESAPGLYLVLTPELQIVAASDAYLQSTMTAREEILGRHLFDVFPDNPQDPDASGVRNLRASLGRVLETGRSDAMPVQKYDVRRPGDEGGGFEERYWSPFNSPVLNENLEVAYIIHRVEDVTEFVRMKQAGRERDRAARRLRDHADRMEAEIFQRSEQVAEANRKLRHANEELARIYGEVERLMAQAGSELLGGTVPQGPVPPEEMPARIGELIVGHKRLQEQLLQAQKMEAVGRLAGGVAHDFNNLLTVITGYAAMLRESQAAGSSRPAIEEIERAVERAATLTHQLLAFSRKQVLQLRTFNPNAVITGMEELLRRLIGEDILLVTILDGGVGNINSDPHQLEQVIMNLAVNARDAMPSGGRLVIESKAARVDSEMQGLRPGDYALLSVTDSGHGMDAATTARIFEPFFTTKELGKGTGLGLSTVFGIVRQSNGLIAVESAPGRGSTFRIYLPVYQGAAEKPFACEAAASEARRTGTVLVVEDEAPLRRLVAKVLDGAGYNVLQAANGHEGLALVDSNPPIDLLLTDVVMPGMSGPELVGRLRTNRPELLVLFMSGYDHALIDQELLHQSARFLPKPFTPRKLLAQIGELIGAGRGGGGGQELVGG